MKLKVLALAAALGFSTMAAQANELPDGPHIVTSGTASVAAVPDIATLAIEVNVAAKDAASAKKQADDRVAQYLSFLEKSGIAKKTLALRICVPSLIMTIRTGKAFSKAIGRCAPWK